MSLQLQASPTESFGPHHGRDDHLNGHAESRVFIELYTGAAVRMIIGRPSSEGKPAIIGLLAFASLLREIWDAAKGGDPYARYWLLKVEVAIAKAEATIESDLAAVRETMMACQPMGIDLGRGNSPRRIDLMFACPYAYHGARLIKQLDTLIIELDTSAEIGALRKADTTRTRLRCERAMRSTFSTSQGFWRFGLTDELVKKEDPKAIDAAAKMGAVPGEVLRGERWPTLLDQALAPSRTGNGHGNT